MVGCIPKPAVSALVVDKGRVLLVKRGGKPNNDLWSLPGGSVAAGETLREAGAREVYEETSLVIEVGDVAGAHEVISWDDDVLLFHYVIVNLFATVISGEPAASSDAADARWVPLGELKNYPTTAGLVERLREMGLEC
jgi:ADP-ribose pyrophosphatase YjhB (NUDIX family)